MAAVLEWSGGKLDDYLALFFCSDVSKGFGSHLLYIQYFRPLDLQKAAKYCPLYSAFIYKYKKNLITTTECVTSAVHILAYSLP